MRILEAIDTFTPNIDGAINVVKFTAEQLNKEDECSVFAPNPPKKSGYKDRESFDVIRCSSIGITDGYRCGLPFLNGNLKKKLENKNLDIIHAHSPFTVGKYCVKFAKKHHIPVILTLHTRYKTDFERALKRFKPMVGFMMRFMMKVFRKADRVWTVSYKAREILLEYGYKGEVDVVRNGTDLVYPANADELVEGVNAAHGLAGKKNVFIFVGRIAMYKNLGLIVDSLKILKNRGVDFTMLMVGGGFDEGALKKKVMDAGLDERFIFAGAVKDRSLLQGYYLRGDLLLFPSTFDVCPLAVIEAAAHKTSAMVVRNSCSAENVVDGDNGYLVDENAESIAEKLIGIIGKDGEYERSGQRAYETLNRTWEDVAREMRAKYAEVIREYKEKEIKKAGDKR